MKTVFYTLTLVLVTFCFAFAGETVSDPGATCPAHRAAEAGYNPFDAFHKVIAPTWHTAWPEKNYDALLAAAPQFDSAFEPIAGLKPTFKSTARAEAFEKNRTELGNLVKAYSEAAAASDKEKVYEILPKLHDAFELTASALLPVHFPEFDGMVITLNMILETHLPKDNTEGIIGSTETLVEKCKTLTAATLPEELAEHKEAIDAQLADLTAIVAKMNECCETKDMKAYVDHAKSLDAKVKAFIEKYI